MLTYVKVIEGMCLIGWVDPQACVVLMINCQGEREEVKILNKRSCGGNNKHKAWW